jgi:thiol-disulfide isomerase/thioredoxin
MSAPSLTAAQQKLQNEQRAKAAAFAAAYAAANPNEKEEEENEKMRPTCVSQITNSSVCQTCPAPPCAAYQKTPYDIAKMYTDISKDEINYSIILSDSIKHTPVCIDIRQVINEIKNGNDKYVLGAGRGKRYVKGDSKYNASKLNSEQNFREPPTGGVSIFYYDPINLPLLIDKEQSCLGTNVIKTTLDSKRNALINLSNETAKQNRIDSIKVIVLLVKLLISANPAQTIIADNLPTKWKDMYLHTADYKISSKKKLSDDLAVYNPFCKDERVHLLSEEQIRSDDELFERFYSARQREKDDPTVIELEKKLVGKSEQGTLRANEIRDILDLDINIIKYHCYISCIAKIVELECSDMNFMQNNNETTKFDKKIAKAYEIFKFTKNFRGATFIEVGEAITGDVCIRSIGSNLISVINQLNSIINTKEEIVIPELDITRDDIDNTIPAKFQECFTNLLNNDKRFDTYNSIWYSLWKYEEKQNNLESEKKNPSIVRNNTQSIENIVDYGFTEEQARQALEASNGNFENAVQSLMEARNTAVNRSASGKSGRSASGRSASGRSASGRSIGGSLSKRNKTRKSKNTNRKRGKSQKRQ